VKTKTAERLQREIRRLRREVREHVKQIEWLNKVNAGLKESLNSAYDETSACEDRIAELESEK